MTILKKVQHFLVNDNSGSVSSEWTVLTALLTVAAISTVGTFSMGVHAVASAIETDISISIDGPADNDNGAIG